MAFGHKSENHKKTLAWFLSYKKKGRVPAAALEPRVHSSCTCNGCEREGTCFEIGKMNQGTKVMKADKKSVEMCAKGKGIWCTNKKVKYAWTRSHPTRVRVHTCACRVAGGGRASAMIMLSRCLTLYAIRALHAWTTMRSHTTETVPASPAVAAVVAVQICAQERLKTLMCRRTALDRLGGAYRHSAVHMGGCAHAYTCAQVLPAHVWDLPWYGWLWHG